MTIHYGDWQVVKKDATFLDAKNYKTPNKTYKKELKDIFLKSMMISAVMPVYNASKYIRESIDSILAQSYENFELIIIDDGSTDNTVDIIKEYKDQRIKLYNLKFNQGIGVALQTGVEKAQGIYIVRVDGDDLYDKDRFKLQKEYLDKNPDITLVKSLVSYFGNEEVEKSARFKGIKQNLEKGKNEAITSEEIKRTLDWHICIPHSSIMARTEIMKEFQYNDYRMGEDYDLFTRLNRAGHKMGTVERILTYVRVSTESLTATSRATLYRTIYDIKREYIDNFFTNGNVYLWGASTMGQYADKVLEEKGLYISGFIDIDENKQGKKLNGKTIYGPEVLNYKSKIITTSIPGRESIVKDLEARGMKQFEDYIVFL